MGKSRPRPDRITSDDVRLMLSSPVYAYGTNLVPAECVAQAVLDLNAQLAAEVRETGVMPSPDQIDSRVLTLLAELEASGQCTRAEGMPPIVPKGKWLQAQIVTIGKLARGEAL